MDKTQQVINAVLIIQDHHADGNGWCGCTQCTTAEKVIEQNPNETEIVAKLLAKSEKK